MCNIRLHCTLLRKQLCHFPCHFPGQEMTQDPPWEMTQESTNLKFRFFELCHFLCHFLCNKGFKLCHFLCHFPGQTFNFVSFPVLGNDTKLIFVSFWFISRSVNYLCHFLCHFLSFPVSFPVLGNDTSVI